MLRGPDNGALDGRRRRRAGRPSPTATESCISTAPEVMTALEAMTPGHGWSALAQPTAGRAKQRLLDALGARIKLDTVLRWRVPAVRELVGRYVAKSKKGPAESRAVLVKAVQPTLGTWFGGDWLALLGYLDRQPADGEVIQTALPAPRFYVEGSERVQQVARERNLPTDQVAAMLASYLGSDAVRSPVQRRVDLVRTWWEALDTAQAEQRPGMPPLVAHGSAGAVPGRPARPLS